MVDATGRLVGVITIDDAMNVLDEEHEQDMLRLAGVGDDSSLSDGVLATARQRLPWLVVNLFTASISAFVISRFEIDDCEFGDFGGADADCGLDRGDCRDAIAGGGGAGAGDAQPDLGQRQAGGVARIGRRAC